jgi:hypothetical protein
MDDAALLVVLAIVVAVNAIATVTLLVLTLRERHARPDVEAATDRGSDVRPAAAGPIVGPAAPGGRAVPGPVQAAATPSASTGDPLAGAITAFLERREGVFTTGVSGEAGQGPPGAAAEIVPAPPPDGMLSGPAIGRPVEPVVPIARQPARPARYVPSGPPVGPAAVPPATAGFASPREPVAAHVVSAGGAPAALEPATAQPIPAQPLPVQPRYRPASRLSVALIGRDGSRPEAAGAAIARLGPVIGGLLRERTRSRDRVAEEGPGRFVVVLPETHLDGAEALGLRLRSTCDAWLGAETPPLGLDLAAVDLPGGVPGGFPEPGRATGPERRRPLALES